MLIYNHQQRNRKQKLKTERGKTRMKKIIFKSLFKANRTYSTLWMAATGKNKNDFREESKVHTLLLNLMSGVCE